MEVNVPASQAWELYGTLQLAKLTGEQLTHVLEKIEGVEGVGTVLKLIFPPGTPDFTSYKKFTKIDVEKRLKEVEVVKEDTYLDLGFTLLWIRFEIIEKSEDSCITRSTIENEVKEEAAANASLVTIEPLVMIMEAGANHLMTKNN